MMSPRETNTQSLDANHGISKQNEGIGRLLDVCFSIAVTQLCDQGKAQQ